MDICRLSLMWEAPTHVYMFLLFTQFAECTSKDCKQNWITKKITVALIHCYRYQFVVLVPRNT
jgi:hypothetical protein